MKEFLGILAVILLLAGCIPYAGDTLRGKTKPHLYTWLIMAIVTATAAVLQLNAGAGAGAWVTASSAAICLSLFVMCINRGSRDITFVDTVCLLLALLAISLWLFQGQSVYSVLILCTASMLGFLPTVRKSWYRPDQETLLAYIITSVRYALGIGALQSYSLTTVLYPSVWLGINITFSAYLIVRRKQLRVGMSAQGAL